MVLKVSKTREDQRSLVLDAECLEALGVSSTEEFEVTRNGNLIELRPLPFDRLAHVRALADSVMAQYDGAFRRLSE